MEVENARSFFGKYSAVTLIAAGKFPASPTLNITRAAMKSKQLVMAMVDATAPVAEIMAAAS